MGQTTMGIMWGVRVPEGVCIDDLPVGVILYDADLHAVAINGAARVLCGLAPHAELWDDENFAGLLDRWCDECEPLIDAHDAKVEAWVAAKPGRMPWRRMDGRDRYVPDYEPDAGVAGFWIAAGASGKDGLPILDEWKSPGYTPVEMTRAGVRSAFPKAYRNAVARWARFRRWCDTHRDLAGAEHFAQTAPSLWLVPTEVA